MKKYEQLKRGYLLLLDKQKESSKLIKEILDLGILATDSGKLAFFKKWGREALYLEFPDVPKEKCQVCLEEKPTTAHHILPKRLKSPNIILRNIRIRICPDCEKKIHPENSYLPEIMQKAWQNKNNYMYIKYYKKCCELNALKQDMRKLRDIFKNFLHLTEDFEEEKPQTQEEINEEELVKPDDDNNKNREVVTQKNQSI